MFLNMKILISAILFLGNLSKMKGDLYSGLYFEDEGNRGQGSKHTIHTFKGRYNEQAQRFTKCESSVEKKEEKLQLINDKPETRTTNTTTEKQKLNDYLITTEKIETETKDSQLLTIHSEPKVENETKTVDTDATDLELGVLSEIIKDLKSSPPSRHINSDPDINNSVEKSTYPTLDRNVVDSTEKHLEFETIIIKKDDDKEFKKNIHNSGRNKHDRNDINENITRRVIPSKSGQEQYPISNNVTLEIPPLEKSQPANNENEKKLQVTDRNRRDDADEVFSFNDPNISADDIDRRASHPTKGFGISDMDKSNLMLIDHPRVCFACSSTNNPSCWSPDMRTPAKYCRKDHEACVTKTYKHRGYNFIIRDCGNVCRNNGLGELGLDYRSCTICHSDLCNGAYVIKSLKTMVLMLLVSIWFKYKYN